MIVKKLVIYKIVLTKLFIDYLNIILWVDTIKTSMKNVNLNYLETHL